MNNSPSTFEAGSSRSGIAWNDTASLHRSDDGGGLLSELKALRGAGIELANVDLAAVHRYLCLRFIPAPCTMFERVRKLPPAHTLVYQNGVLRTSKYWQLSFSRKRREPDEELIGAG